MVISPCLLKFYQILEVFQHSQSNGNPALHLSLPDFFLRSLNHMSFANSCKEILLKWQVNCQIKLGSVVVSYMNLLIKTRSARHCQNDFYLTVYLISLPVLAKLIWFSDSIFPHLVFWWNLRDQTHSYRISSKDVWPLNHRDPPLNFLSYTFYSPVFPEMQIELATNTWQSRSNQYNQIW